MNMSLWISMLGLGLVAKSSPQKKKKKVESQVPNKLFRIVVFAKKKSLSHLHEIAMNTKYQAQKICAWLLKKSCTKILAVTHELNLRVRAIALHGMYESTFFWLTQLHIFLHLLYTIYKYTSHFVQFGSNASCTPSQTPNSHTGHTDFGQVPKTRECHKLTHGYFVIFELMTYLLNSHEFSEHFEPLSMQIR